MVTYPLGPYRVPRATVLGWPRRRPEDVFVAWHGLEDRPVSRWLSFDLPGLAELTEQEYQRRVERLAAGRPPVQS